MAVIDTLNVNLQATTAGLTKGLKSAQGMVQGFVAKLDSPLAKLSGLFAGIFSVNAMKNFVTSGLDAADTISDIATELGTTAEAFNRLRHAAVLSDVSQEQLIGGLEKMERNIGEAAQGSKSAAETFDRLGINFEAFRRLSPDKQFKQVASAIRDIKDPSERAAMAVDVFGKSGMKLIPFLIQGEEGMDALGKGVAGAFSEENLKKFDEADNAFKAIAEAMLKLKMEAALALSPTIVAITKEFEKWLKALTEIVEMLQTSNGAGGAGQGGEPMGAWGRRSAQLKNAWDQYVAGIEALNEHLEAGESGDNAAADAAFARWKASLAVGELLGNPQTAGMSQKDVDRIVKLLEKSWNQQEKMTELQRQQLELLRRNGMLEGVELPP